MVTLAVLTILFAALAYLLLTPIMLYVDTRNDTYFVRQQGIIKAAVLGDKKEVLRIKLTVFFLDFYVYPFRSKKKPSKPKTIKKKKKGNTSFSFEVRLRLLKTLKIKKLVVDIDTGDCLANAKLYPIFAFLNYKFGGFHINFEDRNQLVLHLESKPIRIIKSFINF